MFLTGPPSRKNFFSSEGISDGRWKLPVIGSILIHLLVLGGSVFSSYILPDKEIQEIHTVDLVNIEETLPEKKADPGKKTVEKNVQPPPEQKPEPEPRPEPETISTKTEKVTVPRETQEPLPEKVVSLKPRLTKKKITSPEKDREKEEDINKALEKIKKDLQRKNAEKRARRAEEEARAYARQAVKDLRDFLQSEKVDSSKKAAPPEETGETVGDSEGGSTVSPSEEGGQGRAKLSEAALQQYLAAVYRKIQANWILPEVTDWRDDLEAILAITVTREGTVIKSNFESPSDNIYFNRFVEKTVKKSSPLPPFPDTLEREQIEIGFIFHPEGLK